MEGVHLIPPNRIPEHAAIINETAPPSPTGPYVPGSPNAGPGYPNPLFDQVLASNMRAAAPAPPHPPSIKTIRISHIDEGLLIHKVLPIYPSIAKQTHTQGTVVMQAKIARDGTIQNLQVLSGHPFLISAAMDAVKQWRYRPYILNGEPLEVETQITVNFTLNQ